MVIIDFIGNNDELVSDRQEDDHSRPTKETSGRQYSLSHSEQAHQSKTSSTGQTETNCYSYSQSNAEEGGNKSDPKEGGISKKIVKDRKERGTYCVNRVKERGKGNIGIN